MPEAKKPERRAAIEAKTVSKIFQGAAQDRRACCGTMNNPEYTDVMRNVQEELDQLKRAAETLRK